MKIYKIKTEITAEIKARDDISAVRKFNKLFLNKKDIANVIADDIYVLNEEE